jgi:L-ribulose-5-phosphate 4-epimerase
MQYKELRRDLLHVVLKLYKGDLIQMQSGNVSVRASETHIVITPGGIPYDTMTTEDMVILNLDGSVAGGNHNPSSETPMHMAIYRSMPKVSAVVHSHSPYAMAFATVGRSIPVICTEGLAVGGPIPVAAYACPGTEAQGKVAVQAMKGPPPVAGTLLKNHGALTTGKSLARAYTTACSIEMAARIYFLALQIGVPDILTEEQLHEIEHVYALKRYSP